MISILFILVRSLKRDLATQALEICGEKDRIRGDKINIAPLQISTRARGMEQLDRSGHFHYRKDVVRIFSEKPPDVIPHEHIFEAAKWFAVQGAMGCRNEEAKAKHLLKYGNVVLISGQAGIGKSTLSKLLVEKMLDPNVRLYQAEFVFFIRFRDLNYQQNSDLLEFLTNSAPFISSFTSEDRTKIIQHVEASDNVYIVMDGLDEADIDLKMNSPNINADLHTTAAVFIHHLLSGRLLGKAKKLVTSRPRQLMQLPSEFSSNLCLNLLGLNDEGQTQICSDLCRDDAAKKDRILSRINSRPDLKSLCYVPITCILVMISFYSMDSLKKNVDTLTAILVYAVENWFLKKFKGKFQIEKIAVLALKGFLKNRFYFRERHLRNEGINFENTTAFLFNNIKFELLQGKAVTYFAHLMWQEFFVAVKLRLYSNKEEFQKIVPELESDKFEMVARFLFGLCNKQTLDELLDCVEDEELNTEADRDECEEILKKFVIEKLKRHRDAAIKELDDPYYRSIVPVMSWLCEMDNINFTKQAAGWLRDETEVNGEILPGDIPNVNHILRCRDTGLALKVCNPNFVGGCRTYFFKELHETLDKNSNIQVSKSLWSELKSNQNRGINLNRFQDTYLAKYFVFVCLAKYDHYLSMKKNHVYITVLS